MFLIEIVFANIFIPTLLVLLAATVWRRLSRQGPVPESQDELRSSQQSIRRFMAAGVVTVLMSAAFYAAFAFRNQWLVDWEDYWQRIPAITLVIFWGAGWLAGGIPSPLNWLFRGVLLLWGAWMVFPVGSGWEFLEERRGAWLVAIGANAVVASWFASQLPSRFLRHLLFSWLPCWIAAAFLTAQSFMRVTELLITIGCITGAAAVALARRSVPPPSGSMWITGIVFGGMAALAHGQFNSFLGLSDALTWLAMTVPTLVAGVAYGVSKYCGVEQKPSAGNPEPSTKQALPTIVSMWCVALVGSLAVVTWTQLSVTALLDGQ
ncbi:MAG: hypothetical protein KatS3mg111_3843 [Pirellulaceae bacterium]|nr:MAG: hypothetical protein KatS3mg111_3843 [Pirellulaceae bacterium]